MYKIVSDWLTRMFKYLTCRTACPDVTVLDNQAWRQWVPNSGDNPAVAIQSNLNCTLLLFLNIEIVLDIRSGNNTRYPKC
jgi:hypothetical protein